MRTLGVSSQVGGADCNSAALASEWPETFSLGIGLPLRACKVLSPPVRGRGPSTSRQSVPRVFLLQCSVRCCITYAQTFSTCVSPLADCEPRWGVHRAEAGLGFGHEAQTMIVPSWRDHGAIRLSAPAGCVDPQP